MYFLAIVLAQLLIMAETLLSLGGSVLFGEGVAPE
jgi:hypothetical protein